MESSLKRKLELQKKRAQRVRKPLKGTSLRPRLSVKISGKHIYAQLIDDENGVTLASASSLKQDTKKSKDLAATIGELIAKEAKSKNIEKAVFDRGFKKYHGLIASLADKAREQGLQV